MKILSFGEILWDIVEGKAHLGGAPLNIASHIAQFCTESYILSVVGKDDLGTKAVLKLKELGVNPYFVTQREDKATGTVLVTLKEGQPSYEIKQGAAWDAIRITEKQIHDIQKIDWDCFCFGALAQRSTENRQTLEKLFSVCRFKEVFFDINLRQHYWDKSIIEQSFKHATILKINDEEVEMVDQLLWNEKTDFEVFSAKVSKQYNIKTICITLGSKGALVFSDGRKYFARGEKVKVADTVGAGDSFSAAFLYTFLKTRDVQKAIENGCRLGGFVASCHGAVPVENQGYLNLIKELS